MSYQYYSKDHAQEQDFGKVLDNALYVASRGFSGVARNTDIETQKLGIDIYFYLNRSYFKCDEKAATSYGVDTSTGKGRVLQTFSFELFTTHSENDHVGKDGWFLNPDNLSDSYMVTWIDKFHSIPKWEPELIYFALIRKDSLLRELNKYDLTVDKMKDKCDRIKQCWADNGYRAYREDSVRRGHLTRFHDKILLRDADDTGPYFSASTTKGQFHINVVVPRQILNRISVLSGKV